MAVEDKKTDPAKISELQIGDETQLEAWLKKVPREWVRAIGVRIGLRILPLSGTVFLDTPAPTEELFHRFLTMFRASFVSWATCKYPTHNMSTAADDAARYLENKSLTEDSAIGSAAVAVAAAAKAASNSDLYAVREAARFSANAIRTATNDQTALVQFWGSIAEDAKWLARHREDKRPEVQAQKLMDQPIWLEDVRGDSKFQANFPIWAREPFDKFVKENLEYSGILNPWVDWYRAILPNSRSASPRSAFGKEADIQIATQPQDFWLRASEEVMADIGQLVRGETIAKRPEAKMPANDASGDPTDETHLTFLSDAHDPAVDHLERARLAFVLAGRLNQVWDSMNPDPMREPAEGSNSTGLKVDPMNPGFVIHIDAPWGGGKTTFASFLTQILNPYRHAGSLPAWMKNLPMDDATYWPNAYRRPWHVVNFNAWRHQHVKPPWWVFYEAIRRQCKDAMVRETNQQAEALPKPSHRFGYRIWVNRKLVGFFDWINEQAWRLWTPDFRISLIATVIMTAFIVGLFALDVIRLGEDGIELTLETYGSEAEGAEGESEGASSRSLWITPLILLFAGTPVVWTMFSAITQTLFPGTPEAARNYSLGSGDPLDRFRKHFVKMMKRFRQPIVVVVDDLDRCEPDYVVELLRGMQTILISPRIVFVLLGDRDWIEQAFSEVHKSMKGVDVGPEHELGGRFVEKAIQFSLVLPELSPNTRHGYVRHLLELEDMNEEAENAPSNTKDSLESMKAQTEAILAEEDYGKREAEAAKVRESPDFEGLGKEQKDTVLREFSVRLSLRAAADRSAQRATSHMIEALAPMLPPNPRQIKRIVNAISLMQEAARLGGFADPGTTEWQIMARWVVLMIEWPKSWYTLSRYPGLADEALGLSEVNGELPDNHDALVKLIASNEAAMNLLTFSDDERGWKKKDITSAEIFWLRQLMPPTSGRLLGAGEVPDAPQTAA